MRYKVCKNCGTDYATEALNSKYCSFDCSSEGRKKIAKIRAKKQKPIKIKNKWHKDNPLASRYSSLKGRCKQEGIPFDLEMEDIVIPLYCPVFNILMDGSTRGKTWSFDRLVPEKGYVKGNVRIISAEANRLKNNATIDQLEKIIEYMKKEMAENSQS